MKERIYQMRRGYERERRGVSFAEQDVSMREAGISLEGEYPPVYRDTAKNIVYRDTAKDTRPPKLLVARAAAIQSLRHWDQDELVVHDAATLGRNYQEIIEGLAAIGRTGCKLIVWKPDRQEYVWHPDAAEIAALAAEGVKLMRSEKHRRAGTKTGAPAKLVGPVLAAAQAAWADPSLTVRAAATRVFEVTGVQISSRLMYAKLGQKSQAEVEVLKPKMPAATGSKKKPSGNRKVARDT
jgi:hypothetical protein